MVAMKKAASSTSEKGLHIQKSKKAGKKEKLRHHARSHHRRRRNSFATYFTRVVKNVYVGFTLSHRTVNILDSFVKDMFERIATEASILARQTSSAAINSRETQTAVRLVLPGEICKRAVTQGTLALVRYITCK